MGLCRQWQSEGLKKVTEEKKKRVKRYGFPGKNGEFVHDKLIKKLHQLMS